MHHKSESALHHESKSACPLDKGEHQGIAHQHILLNIITCGFDYLD